MILIIIDFDNYSPNKLVCPGLWIDIFKKIYQIDSNLKEKFWLPDKI